MCLGEVSPYLKGGFFFFFTLFNWFPCGQYNPPGGFAPRFSRYFGQRHQMTELGYDLASLGEKRRTSATTAASFHTIPLMQIARYKAVPKKALYTKCVGLVVYTK